MICIMTIEPIHLLPEVKRNSYIINIQNLVPETNYRILIAGEKRDVISLLPKILSRYLRYGTLRWNCKPMR